MRCKAWFGGGPEPKPQWTQPLGEGPFVERGALDLMVSWALNPATTGAQRGLTAWASPLPLPHSWLDRKQSGRLQIAVGAAVGAFEPRTGGEGKGQAADKECFLKQKRKCWLGRRGKEAASCCWWWLFCERWSFLSPRPEEAGWSSCEGSPAFAPSLLPKVSE